jgi:hypothetical protein
MSTQDSTYPHHGFHADPVSGVCYRTLDFFGFPGYRVGDDGSVWSKWKRVGLGRGSKMILGTAWRKLGLYPNSDGYPRVYLRPASSWYVHRIVLEAFAGPCPEGMVCRHFPDRNPANSRLGNVQWGTRRQNEQDKIIHDTKLRGSRHPLARFDESSVYQIKEDLFRGISQAELARRHRVRHSVICAIAHGRTWSHVVYPKSS